MYPPKHPLWLAGFRPFFALGMIAGLSLPMSWVAMYAGMLPAPTAYFTAVQWHAHEMFFGFGWAVLGGFLLTSTKNWVQVRGYHGVALLALAVAWLYERIGMAWGGNWPPLLFRLSNLSFLAAIVTMLAWTLIRHRATDSYRDNPIFLLILPAFLLAKILLLSTEHFLAGWTMSVALFRIAFLIMLERTLTQFMKGVFQASILRHPWLDNAIKFLALALVAESAMPPRLAAILSVLLALLLLGRFACWQPLRAFTRLDIGIMYLGYLGIVAQLLAVAAGQLLEPGWVGSLPAHLFGFGVMGLIVPAMLVRIAKGHTGRKVVFDGGDKAVLYLMMLAFVLRILMPQLLPAAYLSWLALAALCWFAAFATLAWRYLPFLVQPRVDGKEH